jgi:hypothetical protein
LEPEEIAELIAKMTVVERIRLWKRLREIEGDDPWATGIREPVLPKPPDLSAKATAN